MWNKVLQDRKNSLVSDLKTDFKKYLFYNGPRKYAYVMNKISRNEITSSIGFCGVSDLRENAFTGRLALVVKKGVPYKRQMDRM